MAFFFKLFPEIIEDGRLFIAEPPLYRIDDKNDPFVINKEDYVRRYVKNAMKYYKMGYKHKNEIVFLDKKEWSEFLTETSSYVEDMNKLKEHYKINDRLLESIIEEFAFFIKYDTIEEGVNKINIQHLIDRINTEFPEIYYDDKDGLIKGVIDGKYQLFELSPQLIVKSSKLIDIMKKWGGTEESLIFIKDNNTGTEHELSLLGILKILKKFQPNILHRFKGLGENSPDDIEKTIMNPNTRSLIRVNISDIENDMKIFQLLRGGSKEDASARKKMMHEYVIDQDLIDT